MQNKWDVDKLTGTNHYIATRKIDGKIETIELGSAHCLACAKSDLLAKYGGKVDLRGWRFQGACGSFLYAMQKGIEDEENSS